MNNKSPSHKEKATDSTKVKARVSLLLNSLRGLSVSDALLALFEAAKSLVVTQHQALPEAIPTHIDIGNLKRRHGRVSKIESDPELRDYIHSLKGYYTLHEISALCKTRFGAKRAPSKSAVARYIAQITKHSESPEVEDL